MTRHEIDTEATPETPNSKTRTRHVTFSTLQREHRDWATRNFGPCLPERSVLGLAEEVGEIAHALLKSKEGIRGSRADHRAAIVDGIGDLIVFAAHLCNALGIDMQEAIDTTWNVVKTRDYVKFPGNGVDF